MDLPPDSQLDKLSFWATRHPALMSACNAGCAVSLGLGLGMMAHGHPLTGWAALSAAAVLAAVSPIGTGLLALYLRRRVKELDALRDSLEAKETALFTEIEKVLKEAEGKNDDPGA